MALYRPLMRCLVAATRRGETHLTLSFADIEDMLGFRLSHNALTNPDWWLQDTHGHHAWTRSWQRAGWHVREVNMDGGQVTFAHVKRPSLRAQIDFEIQAKLMPFLDNAGSRVAPVLERGDSVAHEWLAPRVAQARQWLAPRLNLAYEKTAQGLKQARIYYIEAGWQARLQQGLDRFWQEADRFADWLGGRWQNFMAKRQNKNKKN